MTEEQTIRGETTMTWGDQARLTVRPIAKSMRVFSAAMAATLFIVWSISSSDGEWLLLRHAPIDALRLVTLDSWPFFVAGFVLMLALLTGHYARAFYRFPQANRSISYEATRDRLITRDAADFALAVPWSSVIGVRNGKQMMRMQLSAGGWRTVIWRAFAPEDREQILRWAQQTARGSDQPRP